MWDKSLSTINTMCFSFSPSPPPPPSPLAPKQCYSLCSPVHLSLRSDSLRAVSRLAGWPGRPRSRQCCEKVFLRASSPDSSWRIASLLNSLFAARACAHKCEPARRLKFWKRFSIPTLFGEGRGGILGMDVFREVHIMLHTITLLVRMWKQLFPEPFLGFLFPL